MNQDTAHRAAAIVGMGAILPDARDLTTFWQNLTDGRYSISDVAPGRWDPALYHDPDPKAPEKTYSRIGGWVKDAPWEPLTWRLPIPPKVAGAMDRTQKWAIASVREALGHYGYPDRDLDTKRTAVILGNAMGGDQHYMTALRIFFPEFADELTKAPSFCALPDEVRRAIVEETHGQVRDRLPGISEDTMPGELANVIAGRIAALFNLRGPNYICDAACASAMAAITAAIEGLEEHDYDAVITGGIDGNMSASSFVKFCKIGALSATGTRPYAEGADGFVMGEGAVVFLLKRLADAERDGDTIYAVIRATGGSSDGKGKGITAPNPAGQRLAIERAWKNAGVSPATATMVEGHGTSTRVGDVVEVNSLIDVFGQFGLPRGRIALGSVKSNIGHLKGAAGAAGVLKTALALHHKVLPPSLNFGAPNPNIEFARGPFAVNTETRPWSETADGVRRAGVSAFGFGGTNFHAVLEEYVPGRILAESERKVRISTPGSSSSRAPGPAAGAQVSASSSNEIPAPLRGALVLGAASDAELAEKLKKVQDEATRGEAPEPRPPRASELRAPVRLTIDYADASELASKAERASKALAADHAGMWKALRARGVFLGRGPAAKVAFLYTGQGSQYVNMLRDLSRSEPVVGQVFAEADRVLTPLLGGKPLTGYLFAEPDRLEQAEKDLRQTAITQPSVLTVDMALTRLLARYGVTPDKVMGHSLGEYGALVAAGSLSFEHALEAVSARGREMTKVSVDDNGAMVAVFGPLAEIEAILDEVGGYAVIANINSNHQAVVGGASDTVKKATEAFTKAGFRAIPLPVSHAFHTRIVAPASEPLKTQLRRLTVHPPQIPLVANVTGEFYPAGPGVEPEIIELLGKQIASPVQFVKGLHTLYDSGVRVFVEVGPKKALAGMAEDVLGDRPGVMTLFTNHPKVGDRASFNQALCGLYAAGLGLGTEAVQSPTLPLPPPSAAPVVTSVPTPAAPALPMAAAASAPGSAAVSGAASDGRYDALGRLFAEFLERGMALYHGGPGGASGPIPAPRLEDIVISGVGLGLPGTERVFDDENLAKLLRGDSLIDAVPMAVRKKIVDKHVTRLIKTDGTPRFETIDSAAEVIKLAGRPGAFDIVDEFGVSKDRVPALDISTELAIAAGIEALRDAGVPLGMHYKTTTKGTRLPERWMLPEPLRDDTGVIFGSAFPGYDSLARDMERYHDDRSRRQRIEELASLRSRAQGSPELVAELERRIHALQAELERDAYALDRRYLFRILSMGHSQFAELIGARGPNTQINAACASGTQAVSLAQDWIRAGRCRRVVVVTADAVTTDNLLEWIGAGFLASGAAATDELIEEAALPFDRRRHGLILGMGASSMVVESAASVGERGMAPICEVLATATANSAFHGSRLDVGHICQIMEGMVSEAEARHGIRRSDIAPNTVFMSHETYTPARGGSAQAEVHALRTVFGPAADHIVMANTKGYTGHAMGAGVEDAVVVKILETGVVPPVANYKEPDPELGTLNLSRGGSYPVHYGLRLGAGFGSQISMSLLRWTPVPDGRHRAPEELGHAYRTLDGGTRQRWLDAISGHDQAETEVVKRTLRIKDRGVPARQPALPGAAPTLASASPPVHPVAAAPAPTAAPAAPAVAATPTPAPITEEAATTAPPATAAPAADAVDPVEAKVVAIIAGETGYPADMLDLDLDLEADLGIDTVKQAETFAAVRAAYDIPRDDNLQLREFPTLKHVIGWVHDKRPDLAQAAAPVGAPAPAADTPVAPAAESADDPVEAKVVEIIAGETGYPPDMLDLDLDLEADLGIDTVKQAETFAAVRAAYDIPRDDNLQLKEFPTLAHVIQWVHDKRPDLAPGAATPGEATSPSGSAPAGDRGQDPGPAASGDDGVVTRVLEVVAEQTGYPTEMLDLDLDLEADLGIDTVKQAETFAAVRESYDIPRDENLQLKEFPTINHVVAWVREHRAAGAADSSAGHAASAATGVAPAGTGVAIAAPAGDMAATEGLPRRGPAPVLRPALDLCKPTGITLGEDSRVIVMMDQDGVGQSLVRKLEKLGVDTLVIEGAPEADELGETLQSWLVDRPLTGIYWLPALSKEPGLDELDRDQWREGLRIRVKLLYHTVRATYDRLTAGTFVIAATRLGGKHGHDRTGAVAPMGGAVTGFIKTLKRERPDALIKAVDFAASRKTAALADILLAETGRDPGAVEIGHADEARWTLALVDQPAPSEPDGVTLGSDSVVVVTGAAGSIVSAITADLAGNGGTFYLLDLIPAPDPDDPDLVSFSSDRDGLKRELFERLAKTEKRVTPVMIEKHLAGLERAHAACAAIQAIERAGGTARYRQVDLTDESAVAAIIDEVRQGHGRIDLLLHAAGLEISRMVPDKTPREFELVFDVKADGFFHLLHAIGDMPLGAVVGFSSIAGRFGNAGQTDYSAANDLLCKFTTHFRAARPDTRAIALDWTAWRDIGMAARGSIPRMMEMAGIDMLPPEAGIPVIRRELALGGASRELVVAQALGVLMNEWDDTGGLAIDAVESDAALSAPARGPMLAKTSIIRGMDVHHGLMVETELQPTTQPFLDDHRIDGTPVLPGVMGVQAFAEAARLLLPDWFIAAVEDVDFLAPFKFYRDQPRRLVVHALFRPAPGAGEDGGDDPGTGSTTDLIAECRLIGTRDLPGQAEPQITTHFRARVRLAREPTAPQNGVTVPERNGASAVQSEDIYRIYFHGPAYQVLDQVWRSGPLVVGAMPESLPENHTPADAPAAMEPRLIELCFQTAGIWEIGTTGKLALPLHIDRVRTIKRISGQSGPLYAVVEQRDGGGFDARVSDRSGNVYVILEGYRTVELGGVDPALREPLQKAVT